MSYTDPEESETFVAKLDSTGRWLWTVSTEHPSPNGNDYGRDIAVDGAGNSYATGAFSGTTTFGSTTATSRGRTDLFVWKVSSQGD